VANDAKIVIIGAGVVGLAIAYELSKKYSDIFILEKNRSFGQETSCRSSEVIHSGIYYPKNSLKAKLCINGRKMLYQFCDENNISYRKCGKLIIANSKEEIVKLDPIMQQAQLNGVDEVIKLNKDEISKIEPNIKAEAALFFSETGIFDSYGFMKELEIKAIHNHVEIVYESEVVGLSKEAKGYKLSVKEKNGSKFIFSSDIVINAAGLNSDKLSKMMGIERTDYKLHYWKGEYFAVGNGKNRLISRLVYPLPEKDITGLGIHATIDLSGGLRLGPNAIYLKDRELDYGVEKNHQKDFYKAAKQYMPFLNGEDLYPGESGIRPKLQGVGEPFRDFVILEEKEAGFKNYINLIGIESPGLTASLAIASYIKGILIAEA